MFGGLCLGSSVWVVISPGGVRCRRVDGRTDSPGRADTVTGYIPINY